MFIACQSGVDEKENEAKPQQQELQSQASYLKAQIKIHPDSTLLIEELLQWYRSNNKYAEAIHFADSMIQIDERNKSLHRILAVLFYEVNDTPNAIKHFENAVAFSPQISDWLSLGSLYAGIKNIKSLSVADYIEKSDPEKYIKEAHYIRGTYFESLRDWQKAIEYFDKCIQTEFGFMEAYREKAICLIEMKKYEDALIVLNKAVTLNNRFVEGYYWMGVCYEKQSQLKLAIESYQQALMFDSSFEEAREATERLTQKQD
jgi:tetratricopeptide (TPR) repeat protein